MKEDSLKFIHDVLRKIWKISIKICKLQLVMATKFQFLSEFLFL